VKQLAVTILLLLIYYSSIAQNFQTMKGRILQIPDSLPVVNAHIYIESNGIGTTSNENGEFAFHYIEESENKEVTISSIGLVSVQISFSSYINPLIIYLEEDQLILEVVTVTAIEPTQILLNVVDNIKKNYPQGKFRKEIYYKESFSVNNKPIRYLEIVADLVQEGFSNRKQNPYKYDLFIKEKRPGFNIDTTFEGGNGIGVLHWLNGPKRYLKKNNFKNYDIQLVGYSTYRNNDVFKLLITSKGTKKIVTSMFITTETFALVAINQWYENNNITTVPENSFRYLKWNESVDFIQLGAGDWYINSINDFREVISVEGDITEIHRMIRLTDINVDVNIDEKNKITRDTDLHAYPIPYNADFWDSYNAPLETEEEKRVKNKLLYQKVK